MTDTTSTPPPSPQAQAQPAKKKKKGGVVRWIWSVFGPALLVGGAVWAVLKTQTDTEHALFLGALAGAIFLIAWNAMSRRLRKAGRSLVEFLKSAFWALISVAVVIGIVWYFFFR